MNVSLKTNRTNKYAHVPMCREHVWRTVRSVCAYGARVVHHLLIEVSTGTVTRVVSTRCFTGLVRDGLKFPLDETCTNKYAHVVVVREHVWRTVCSVCATGARVAQPFLSNS